MLSILFWTGTLSSSSLYMVFFSNLRSPPKCFTKSDRATGRMPSCGHSIPLLGRLSGWRIHDSLRGQVCNFNFDNLLSPLVLSCLNTPDLGGQRESGSAYSLAHDDRPRETYHHLTLKSAVSFKAAIRTRCVPTAACTALFVRSP